MNSMRCSVSVYSKTAYRSYMYNYPIVVIERNVILAWR